MDKLIIRLLKDSSLVEWCWIDASGSIQKSGYQTELRSIPAIPEAHVTVLIPTVMTFITEMSLPPKIGVKHWRAACASNLEDQLSEELDDVHYAIGPPDSENRHPVVVIKREFFMGWLERLREANIDISVMIPDCYALPWQADHVTVWCDQDLALVRTSKNLGFSIETDQLNLVLPEYPIDLWHSGTGPQLDHMTQPIQSHEIPSDYLSLFAKELSHNPVCNLLQAEFAVKVKSPLDTTQLLRWAGQVFLVWLVIFILGYSFEWWVFKGRNQYLETSITSLYREVFPDAKSIVSPKQRIERELVSLNQSGSQTDFLPMMSAIETVQKNLPEVTIVSAEYHGQSLQIQVTAKNFQHLDKLDVALDKQGLRVKRENASSTTEGVSARFSLSGGSV